MAGLVRGSAYIPFDDTRIKAGNKDHALERSLDDLLEYLTHAYACADNTSVRLSGKAKLYAIYLRPE